MRSQAQDCPLGVPLASPSDDDDRDGPRRWQVGQVASFMSPACYSGCHPASPFRTCNRKLYRGKGETKQACPGSWLGHDIRGSQPFLWGQGPPARGVLVIACWNTPAAHTAQSGHGKTACFLPRGRGGIPPDPSAAPGFAVLRDEELLSHAASFPSIGRTVGASQSGPEPLLPCPGGCCRCSTMMPSLAPSPQR